MQGEGLLPTGLPHIVSRPGQSQGLLYKPIQNTVVQSIELQGNRCGTGKSRQKSRVTGIAKFGGGAPLMTVQFTNNTGVAPS